jgi:hypothetical protein
VGRSILSLRAGGGEAIGERMRSTIKRTRVLTDRRPTF